MRLKDNVAIITGAGQGIGQATAVKFAKEGAKVAVCDINEASVEATVALITEGGGEAIGFVVDVTDKDSIARMVEGVMAKWGRIDTLVNNAGIVEDAQFKKMSDDQFDRVIDVNLKGVYNCTKAVVDIMLDAELGMHPQCVVDRRHLRQLRPDQLRGDQVRRHRHGQDVGARAGPQGHPRQRHLPGLHRNADPLEDAGQDHRR